jgi:hypothetical protein
MTEENLTIKLTIATLRIGGEGSEACIIIKVLSMGCPLVHPSYTGEREQGRTHQATFTISWQKQGENTLLDVSKDKIVR